MRSTLLNLGKLGCISCTPRQIRTLISQRGQSYSNKHATHHYPPHEDSCRLGVYRVLQFLFRTDQVHPTTYLPTYLRAERSI